MLPWRYIMGSRNLLRPYGVILSTRTYAARKGYREKAKKKKVKVEEKKVGFIPHNLRNLDKFKPTTSRRIDDSWKRDPTDNVYLGKFYKWKVYSFAEALQCHRESHHPTVYNLPSAPLNVTIELDMRADKKNKYIEKFTRIVGIPCPFNHGETRKIVAFCKSTELQQVALDAGANVSGGSELIKSIQVGDLSMHEYQYIVAHNDILPELVSIRGLLKRNFPTMRNGTLTNDVAECIERLSTGINYSTQRDSYEEDYGWIDTRLGTLDMTDEQLEGNLKALLLDINSVRPKRDGPFITRCLLISPPSVERLKIDHNLYLEDVKRTVKSTLQKKAVEESDDLNDEPEQVELVNKG